MTIDYSDHTVWGSGNFFRFQTPGDNISGNLVDFSVKHWDATDDRPASVSPVLHLEQNDGTIIEVTVSHADLKKQLREMQPQIGQYVGIKYSRKVGNMCLFGLIVTAGRPLASKGEFRPLAGGAQISGAALDQGEVPF